MTESWWQTLHLQDCQRHAVLTPLQISPPPPFAERTKGFSDMEGKTMHIYDYRRWSGRCTVMINMYCDWLLTHGWMRLQYCIVCMCCMYYFWKVYVDSLCATNFVLFRGQFFWRLCTVGMHVLSWSYMYWFLSVSLQTEQKKSKRFLH